MNNDPELDAAFERALTIFNQMNMVLGQHGIGDVMTAMGLLLGTQAQGDKDALARWVAHISVISNLYMDGHIIIDDLRAAQPPAASLQ